MDYNSSRNQEIKRMFVDREVVECASTLVWELCQKAEHFPDYQDELYGAFEGQPDFEEAASQEGWIQRDEDGIFINPENNNEASDADNWEELCDLESIDADDYRLEILEHWIVSDYLARKLREHGELILDDFFGFTIWGRSSSGQAILLDYVISQICEEMEILEGQRNEWK